MSFIQERKPSLDFLHMISLSAHFSRQILSCRAVLPPKKQATPNRKIGFSDPSSPFFLVPFSIKLYFVFAISMRTVWNLTSTISKTRYRNLYFCFCVVSVQSRFRYSLPSQRVIRIYPEFKGISTKKHHNKVSAMIAEPAPAVRLQPQCGLRCSGASLSKGGKISKRCARGRKCLCQHNRLAHLASAWLSSFSNWADSRNWSCSPTWNFGWIKRRGWGCRVGGFFAPPL